MTPDDLAVLHTPGTPTISPDATTVVYSATRPDLDADDYVGHLWQVPADGSAPPRPLTRGHRDTQPAYSPDGRWVAFLRTAPQGKPQLYVVEANGGEPVALTDAPLGVGQWDWSPDSNRLVYVARVPEEGRYVPGGDASAEAPRHITIYDYRSDNVGFTFDRRRHLFVVDLPTDLASPTAGPTPLPASRQVTTGDTDVTAPRWMPDGRHVVAVGAVHTGHHDDLRADILVVDVGVDDPVAAQNLRRLTDADLGSSLWAEAVCPAPDGSAVFVLAVDVGPTGRDFVATQTALYRIDLPDAVGGTPGVPQRLTDPLTRDLVSSVLHVTGNDVLVADQRRGRVVLLAVGPGGGETRVLIDDGVVGGVAVAAPLVALTRGEPTSAGEVLALDLDSGTVNVLTDLGAALRPNVRIPTEITATAPDGYPVHGWVTFPDPQVHGAGPHPVVLMIHGGPFAQYDVALFDELQVLAGAGYAVVHGNPRGSSGYGAAHGRAIRGAMGTVDTDDVLALLDFALDHPELGARLDGSRLGVMGGSYGGYLTAWLTTRTDRFDAAIVERGFLDPTSFVGSSDIGWFFGLEYLGDNTSDQGAADVAAQSPMAHVGTVNTPTLVIHSERDWRCPVEQGQRWFVELKRRGVPAELLLFPGEGHELTRSGLPSHRKARFEHVLRWWEERLGGED